MQQATRFLLGTTALAGAMLASATVQANECVSDKLLSNVEGYISNARDDAGEARWQRALDTLKGNISWIEGTDVEGVQTDGYWTGVTLAEASLNADLRKESRWVPIKTAIHCMLRAGTYGVAAEKAWYQSWGGWNSLPAAQQALVEGLPTKMHDVNGDLLADDNYSRFAMNAPVAVGNGSQDYKFTAELGNMVSLNPAYKSFRDTELEITYQHIAHSTAPWNAKLKGFGVQADGSGLDIGTSWDNLQWVDGALSQANEKGDLLTGQFYRHWAVSDTVVINGKEHDQYPYKIAGGVITADIAATYVTDSVTIPASAQ